MTDDLSDRPSFPADSEHPIGPPFRSGFVALLGEPNVGKSTLLNAILQFKLSIVSPKPQTTRDKITGIHTDDSCQIVFVDTPGVMNPRDIFNENLRDRALESIEGADVIYHMIEATQPHPLPDTARDALALARRPVFLVVNKSDRLQDFQADMTTESLLRRVPLPFDAARYAGIFFISALNATGLDRLLDATRDLLPEGPPLYDPEQVTDRDLRFLAAEIVREKVLSHTEQEIPYSVATQTETFIEREDRKFLVRVVIHVEHESQKGIVIGQGGAMLRAIGSAARPEIEELCEHPVFLELWVKVRKNWRKKESDLRYFGYKTAKPPRKKQRHKK